MKITSPDRYPALWLRMRHRFGPRTSEWMLAVIMTLWGAVLLMPETMFAPDRGTYDAFNAIFGSEVLLGTIMLMVGLARIGGLIVNGLMPVVTPWIRVVSAGVGFLVFVLISVAFALSSAASTWIAVYPVFALVELVNIYRAAQDAGDSNAVA